MKQHKLKCWGNYWEAVADKSKPFEVRRDDRGFQKGDEVYLIKTDNTGRPINQTGNFVSEMSAPAITAKISYILTGGQFGLEPGYVVLGLKNISVWYP